MNSANKKFFVSFLTLILLPCLSIPAYSSWMAYKNIRHMDLDGDFHDEIIVETKHGAGSNHYIEDLRVFKDKYPNLDLVFTVRTLDSNFGFEPSMKQYNFDVVSDVKFTEPNPQNGRREIIVKSKKVHYKDTENKIIDKQEDLRTKIFQWNGDVFVETKIVKDK